MRGLLYRDMKCVVYRTFWMFLYFIIMDLIVTVVFKMANTDEAFKIYPVLMAGMGALFFIMIQIIPGEIMKTEEKKEWKYYLISTGLGVEKIVLLFLVLRSIARIKKQFSMCVRQILTVFVIRN